MTKKQWEDLTPEAREKIHQDNYLLSTPLEKYEEELKRVEEIKTRAKALGVETEEHLSANAYLSILEATGDIKFNKELYKLEFIDNVRILAKKDIVFVDRTIKRNIKKASNGKLNDIFVSDIKHSFNAMSYLTPGEQLCIAKQMNDRDICRIINKNIRLKKDNIKKYSDIRQKGYDSLKNLGLTQTKDLSRGVNNISNKLNLLNPNESLGDIANKLLKGSKKPVIQLSGGSYPFSSSYKTAERFAKQKGVIFKLKF